MDAQCIRAVSSLLITSKGLRNITIVANSCCGSIIIRLASTLCPSSAATIAQPPLPVPGSHHQRHASSTSCIINVMHHQRHASSTSCIINVMHHQRQASSTSSIINVMHHQRHASSTSCIINVMHHQRHASSTSCIMRTAPSQACDFSQGRKAPPAAAYTFHTPRPMSFCNTRACIRHQHRKGRI